MAIAETSRSTLGQFDEHGPTNRTISENLPETDALFELLAQGEHPDFQLIMKAISEMSLFITKGDPFESPDFQRLLEMSGNKCRFCC